jgi:hypothetical protein
MTTSLNQSVLSEIVDDKPIPAQTLRYFRRILQNRLHELVLQVFIDQQANVGLSQKQLAGRLGKEPAQINRWLHTAGNWEFDTLSDLLLAMKVDLNDPAVTPIAELIRQANPGVAAKRSGVVHKNKSSSRRMKKKTRRASAQ